MTDFDLRAFREKHGFSQTDLAELWDVTQNMISKFEVADAPPAIARYAAKATEEELTGKTHEPQADPVDTQPLLDRIAELEAQLKAKPKEVQVTTEQPKPRRRRLGRAKGAMIHGMKPSE